MSWLTPAMRDLLLEAAWQTVLMVGASAAIAVLLGPPLALLLLATAPGGLAPNAAVNRPLGLVVNAMRSTPFIILMVAIVPEKVREVAARPDGPGAGLVLRIVEFTDYIQPNVALAGGDLDANSYQHLPFLEQQVRDRRLPLVRPARRWSSRWASTPAATARLRRSRRAGASPSRTTPPTAAGRWCCWPRPGLSD